jgi:hypothetical protein
MNDPAVTESAPPPFERLTPTLTGPGSETFWEGSSRAGVPVRLTADWNPYHGAGLLYYSLAYRSERRYTPFAVRAQSLLNYHLADATDPAVLAAGPRGGGACAEGGGR